MNAAGQELAGLAVVDVLLEQRLADALGAAAVDLAEHDRPVLIGLPTSSTVV